MSMINGYTGSYFIIHTFLDRWNILAFKKALLYTINFNIICNKEIVL